MCKPNTAPKRTKRKGNQQSALSQAASTKPQPTVQAQPKKKSDPKLVVAPLADFDHGVIVDIPGTIAALVKRDGDGVISYAPLLNTVGAPGQYNINVSVAEGTNHTPGGPVALKFEIRKLDPKLVVGKLEDFDYGTVADIPAAIAAQVKRDGDGVISYAPLLNTLGAPGHCVINVSVAEGTLHKPAGPIPLNFEIRKLDPKLTVGKMKDEFYDSNKKRKIPDLVKNLIARQGDGVIVSDPPLADLTDAPGDYSVKIWCNEGTLHKKSEEATLTFKIFLSHQQRNEAFQAWLGNATDQQKKQVGKKQTAALVGVLSDGLDKMPQLTSVDEITEALNKHVKADIPTKEQVWAALGHGNLKGKADWKIAGNWTTARDVKMHMTISYDSIRVPQKKADWNQTAAALYTYMFEGVPIDKRVHVTLESANTESGKVHVFIGNTNGAGKAWAATDFQGQMGEMMTKLSDFKNDIIAAIPNAKTVLKVT